MNLLYIENKNLLGKLMEYLKDTRYTTDLEESYDTVIFAEISPRIQKFIEREKEKKKRIVFLSYLEENKIYIQSKLQNKSSKLYMRKIASVCSISDLIITSLPFFKNLLKQDYKCQIEVIEKELPILNISKATNDIFKKNHLNRRKKRFLLIDLDYHFLSYAKELAFKYPKSEIIYIGYRQNYLLSSRDKKTLKELPENIKFIYYYDLVTLTDFVQISDMIISFEDVNFKQEYLYIIFLLKKEFMMKQSLLYEDYLINSKNIYTFKTKDGLLKKLDKIEYDRLANLTDNAYDLIKNCTFEKTKEKFEKYL